MPGAYDVPVLDAGNTFSLGSIPVNTSFPKGGKISSFLGTSVSDVDSAAAQGIVVFSVGGHGSWWYNTNNGQGSWYSSTITPQHAVMLRSTDFVGFLPDQNFAGTSSFSFRAWDQTTGSAGAYTDISSPGSVGGTTAFSVDVGTTTIVVGTAGSIQGQIFEDLNDNGVKNNGEPGQSEWTVYLDADGNEQLDTGEIRATSTSGGGYAFAAVAPGSRRPISWRRSSICLALGRTSRFTIPSAGHILLLRGQVVRQIT